MGRRAASVGHAAALALSIPSFPDHATAIRHTIGHTMHDPLKRHEPLNAAAVLDLRVSVRGRVADPSAPAFPHSITYNTAADIYEVRHNGVVICGHARIEVVAALLRGEAYEPGFIAKVLDARYSPDTLSLDADAREAKRRDALRLAAESRARREAEEDARREKARQTPLEEAPADLTLDDLFIPPGLPLRP